MTRLLRQSDAPPVARTAITDDEDPTDALLRAAARAGISTDESENRLYEQLRPDALDRLVSHQRSRPLDEACTLVLSLWDRTFVLTESAVAVYR